MAMVQKGRVAQWVLGTNMTSYPVAVSGAQGSVSTPTWVSVSLVNFVPTTAAKVKLLLNPYSGSGNTQIMISSDGHSGAYTSTSNPSIVASGQSGYVLQTPTHELLLTTDQTFYVAIAGSTEYIHVMGWEDNV
jgi:hypothetical protein